MTMKNKQQLIAEYLAKPYEIGETICVRGLGRQNKEAFGDWAKIIDINQEGVFIKHYDGQKHYCWNDIQKVTSHIGANPMSKRVDNMVKVLYNLESLLKDTDVNNPEIFYEINGFAVKRVTDNPVVLDKDGNVFHYQRPYCWTLEQKQLLISSIYENISCGLVLVRRRSDEELQMLTSQGIADLALLEIVDGKQRMAAVHEFVNDGFVDVNGLVFSNFSQTAKNKFKDFTGFTYGQLPENTSDKEIQAQFLLTNFTGVPQSKEHLDYVKSIKI